MQDMSPRALAPVLVVGCLMAAAAPVVAQDPIEQAGEDLARAQEDRDHPLAGLIDSGSRHEQVGLEGDTARILVTRDGRGGGEGVLATYDPSRGAIAFAQRDPTARASAETLRLRLVGIVEFEDVDGDGLFRPGTDTIVARHRINELEWTTDTIQAASGGHVMSARGSLPAGGTLRVDVATLGGYAGDDSERLTLDDVRFRFTLEDMPKAHDNTGHAVFVRDQQRGHVAGVPAEQSFPWSARAEAVGGELGVVVTQEDRSAGTVREEASWLTLARSQGADPAAGAMPALVERIACVFFFRC